MSKKPGQFLSLAARTFQNETFSRAKDLSNPGRFCENSDVSTDAAEIEVLTLRHLPEIVSLMEQVYKSAQTPIGGFWNRDLLKQELEIGQGIGLREDGFGLSSFILFRLYESHREITLLATHPERQRRGDMAFLLAYMLERKSPSERIWLEVHAENAPALKLYEKLGFQQVGRRPKYYRDGGDAILFTLGST